MATNEEVIVKLTGIDSSVKSQEHRIDKMEERQDGLEKLVNSVSLMAQEIKYIKGDMSDVKDSVKTLTMKPAKRWDGLVDKIIALFVAGVFGFLMAQISL